ncbi:hypothetical protein [Roseibium sp. MMSF_3544]|uniref:hypothetical protein n=1 Tax=unclassified Roseibium TaxID=2629323 RepID=UPI00273DD52F|nr:hypothetical protein [Roseibium sp. MMSF_3544]
MIIDANGIKHTFENDGNLKIPIENALHFKLPISNINCWYDYSKRSFCCDRLDMFLFEYMNVGQGEGGRVFVLHIESRSISFSHKEGVLGWLGGPEERDDGTKYWEIDEIGLPFKHKDKYRARTYYPLTNAQRFSSQAQQDSALEFVVASLSKYTTALSAAHGKKDIVEVLFSQSLDKRLRSGALIDV